MWVQQLQIGLLERPMAVGFVLNGTVLGYWCGKRGRTLGVEEYYTFRLRGCNIFKRRHNLSVSSTCQRSVGEACQGDPPFASVSTQGLAKQ